MQNAASRYGAVQCTWVVEEYQQQAKCPGKSLFFLQLENKLNPVQLIGRFALYGEMRGWQSSST
jgi:hypothetical protein